ncbi:MAG: hypothetical protein AAFO69_06775 [Bacteroidota bacterium]
MNSIEVTVASRVLYVVRLLLAMAVAFTTVFFIAPPPENSELLFLLAAAPGYLLVEQLTKKLYVGKVIMEMDKEGLQFTWTKQILFHNKPDFSIKWSEISEHAYEGSSHLDQFVLKLKNGKKVQFHFRFMDDQFMKFYNNMQELTGAIAKVDDSVSISRTPGFFETTFGKWLVFGFGVLILLACVLALVYQDWQDLKWFGLVVLFIMGLAMVIPRIVNLVSKDESDKD